MKEYGRTQSEREIARLKNRNETKSPVKENVKKFEKQSRSPMPETSRSKSPGTSNQRPNTLFSPTRSKSPELSSPIRSKSPGVQTRSRSKSPGFYTPTRNHSPNVGSPTRSKSPGIYPSNRSKSPAVHSPTRGLSPGTDTYSRTKSPMIDTYTRSNSSGINTHTRSKSPGIDTKTQSKSREMNTINRAKSPLASTRRSSKLSSPTRSKSPGVMSPGSSPSKSPGSDTGGSKWTMSFHGWAKESPVTAETTENFEGTPGDEILPTVGDTVDLSWYFDNIEYVTNAKADEALSPAVEDVWPGAENPGTSEQSKQRFRNSLNYNIAAWEDEERYEDRPKKADEFIQRLCDQVRNQVEYLCGMNFIKYKALSYKVHVAGSDGIFYYIKVNVWQNYCLHLRIFSHKNELKAVPALQAILERAQPDNGNIEFF